MPNVCKINIGDKFSKLTAVESIICEKRPRNQWLCRCDCGEETIRSASQLRAEHKNMSCGKCCDDITGKRYGNLVAIRRVGKDKRNNTIWEVLCDCGKFKDIRATNFKGGTTTSCGSCKFNLLNKKFGSLSVIEKLESNAKKQVVWSAQCDCGRLTTATTRNLTSGHKKTCGKCYNDLTGKKFGNLTAIKRTGKLTKDRGVIWLCNCDCGNDKCVAANSLVSGGTKSCGCLFLNYIDSIRNKDKKKGIRLDETLSKDRKHSRRIDLSGKVFGKLTVNYAAERKSGQETLWMCSCSCGNEKIAMTSSLTSFSCRSCGCKKRRGHGGTYKSKLSGAIESYDSHWELIRMKMLDDDSDVVSWTKVHKIKISYDDNYNGIIKQRNYIPDFLIKYKEHTVLEELKGFTFNNATVDAKTIAAEQYCHDNNIEYRFIDAKAFERMVKGKYGKTVRTVIKNAFTDNTSDSCVE